MAQTTDELIERHIKALGGRDKYNISTTIYLDTATLLIRKTVQRGVVSGKSADIVSRYIIVISANHVRMNQTVDPVVFKPQKEHFR